MSPVKARFLLERENFSLDVDVEFPAHGITAIFGPSGCGKTSLLRCLAGLEKPDGTLTINGEKWQDSANAIFLKPFQRSVAVVFQEARLFSHLSVEQNILYGYRRRTNRQAVQQQQALTLDEVVELLAIGSLMQRMPYQLSGGEQQRVAIARALMSSPSLLLMDEPLSALDQSLKSEIMPFLDRLHQRLSIPVVYVTHSLDEVLHLADHLVLMHKGEVVQQGNLNQLIEQGRLKELIPQHLNIIPAQLVETDDSVAQFEAEGHRLRVSLETTERGVGLVEASRLVVEARDIVISLQEFPPSNCQNHLQGIIETISAGYVGVRCGGLLLDVQCSGLCDLAGKVKPGQAVYLLINHIRLAS